MVWCSDMLGKASSDRRWTRCREVFAFNINQASMLPPRSGWRFPLRGPVDHSLRIVPGRPVRGMSEVSESRIV